MKIKFLIFAVLVLLFSCFVCADLGPKPTVDINISYGGNDVNDVRGIMLDCREDKDLLLKGNCEGNSEYNSYEECIQARRQLNAQSPETILLNTAEYDSLKGCYWIPATLAWGGCKDGACHFSYFPPETFKLALFVPSLNKTVITNDISRKAFNSHFTADISSEGTATIKDVTPISSIIAPVILPFIEALIITLILELLVALIFLSIAKISKKVMISVVIANLISLPAIWFGVSSIQGDAAAIALIIGEIAVFVFEAFLIYWMNKSLMTLKKSFLLSLIMNLASLLLGGIIILFLNMLGISYF
jgi:hypothetical protein